MQIADFATGKTRAAGLLGNPVEHSVSPQLHNTISGYFNVPIVYLPFKVEPENLGKAVAGLKALGFLGFNVTIPYKREVIKYLDEVSREALLMGAVNTVKCTPEGLFGYNTDADGFVRSFTEEAGMGFKGKKVLIIGAGGASRAIAVKIAFEGAEKIDVANRHTDKAAGLAELINDNVRKCAKACGPEILNNNTASESYDIIINTTPAGMHPDVDASPVGGDFVFGSSQVVYDAIYNPLKTTFLKNAEEAGCKTVNGLGMLFYQGIGAYEIFTGIRIPADAVSELRQTFVNYIKK